MHLGEEELEEYALGLLPPLSVQQFEMHLLVCDRCQDRLAEMDLFVGCDEGGVRRFPRRQRREDASRNVSSTDVK
jgi:hypothetical protein